MKSKLTIGIPTYNRYHSVSALITRLEEWKGAKILVIDDASTQKEYANLDSIVANNDVEIEVLRNTENLGYARTFVRLIEECQSEYLLIIADDDDLISSGVEAAIEFMVSTQASFGSPQFLRNGSIYRGQRVTRKIEPAECMSAASHAPGLIYRVQDAKKYIELESNGLKVLLHEKCSFTVSYPQVTLLIHMLIGGDKVLWMDTATVSEGESLPSGIKDPEGAHYWEYASRMRQAASLDSLISSFPETKTKNDLLDSSRIHYLDALYNSLNSASKKNFARKFTLISRAKRLLSR